MFLLANHGKLISPLPYLSDLMADDSFLFPSIHTTFKGKWFHEVEGRKKNFIAELSAVPLNAFNNYFVQLLEKVKSMLLSRGSLCLTIIFPSTKWSELVYSGILGILRQMSITPFQRHFCLTNYLQVEKHCTLLGMP